VPGIAEPDVLEIWGGIECSVVRIGDTWRNQVRETGHYLRAEADIDRIAALGIRKLRYPLLWEEVERGTAYGCNWAWHDVTMKALQKRGIEVIAGLLHHGSGPSYNSLLDLNFPRRLAAHAGAAADRYPFVRSWTPVNEALTTARFSCLYGHWYPHLRDEQAFYRAVVTQTYAVLLSARAIRARIPNAKFIQTEDIGRLFGTEATDHQVEYENRRRWISLDLLCGRVDRAHWAWNRLQECGVPSAWLDDLASGEGTPDFIGLNYYVTSDRFLDHRLSLYPQRLHGGNGRMTYVDTEAVRAGVDPTLTGWHPRLKEIWHRYGRPLVITEAHLTCEDPREQVRWLLEAWEAAQSLRSEGVDIRAVTAWALFGLMDWDSMLCRQSYHYEPGVFDARSVPPRPTELAIAVAALAKQGYYSDPTLEELGWWRREDRIFSQLRNHGSVSEHLQKVDCI